MPDAAAAALRPISLNSLETLRLIEHGKVTIYRDIEPQPQHVDHAGGEGQESDWYLEWCYPTTGCMAWEWQPGEEQPPEIAASCPLAQVGEWLSVREPFWADWRDEGCVIYDATPEFGKYRSNLEVVRSTRPDNYKPTREECRRAMIPRFWSPGSAEAMPEWASRLIAQCKGVEVDRIGKRWSWAMALHRGG